jgi:hypothetical protein
VIVLCGADRRRELGMATSGTQLVRDGVADSARYRRAMKKSITRVTRLALRRETLRDLVRLELAEVRGGDAVARAMTSDCSHPGPCAG